MDIPSGKLIEIGVSRKPHGINGELTVSFEAGLPEVDINLSANTPADALFLIFDIDGLDVPFRVISMRPKGHNGAIVAFKGITSDAQAALLNDKKVYVTEKDIKRFYPEYDAENEAIEDEDESRIYLDDLLGYDAFKVTGGKQCPIGKISGIDESTANVLFIITTPEERELMIPAADDLIDSIDTDAGRITFDIPEALLTINLKGKDEKL